MGLQVPEADREVKLESLHNQKRKSVPAMPVLRSPDKPKPQNLFLRTGIIPIQDPRKAEEVDRSTQQPYAFDPFEY